MCESVKVARMASERIKEECQIQSGGKKQSQKNGIQCRGIDIQKKASTEALAFSGLKSVALNEDCWWAEIPATEVPDTGHRGQYYSLRQVVSDTFSILWLVFQRLRTMLIAEPLTD